MSAARCSKTGTKSPLLYVSRANGRAPRGVPASAATLFVALALHTSRCQAGDFVSRIAHGGDVDALYQQIDIWPTASRTALTLATKVCSPSRLTYCRHAPGNGSNLRAVNPLATVAAAISP